MPFLAYGGRHAQSGRRLSHDKILNERFTSLSSLTKHPRQWMKLTNCETSSHAISNEILKPNRAHGRAEAIRQVFFLAYCGRHAQSGRRLSHDKILNERFTSLSSLTKHPRQWMKLTNCETSSHAISNEILKPNRVHGRAEAIRQVFFLAYCGRHAPSGRRLSRDETCNEYQISLSCLTRLSLKQKTGRSPFSGKRPVPFIRLSLKSPNILPR